MDPSPKTIELGTSHTRSQCIWRLVQFQYLVASEKGVFPRKLIPYTLQFFDLLRMRCI